MRFYDMQWDCPNNNNKPTYVPPKYKTNETKQQNHNKFHIQQLMFVTIISHLRIKCARQMPVYTNRLVCGCLTDIADIAAPITVDFEQLPHYLCTKISGFTGE